MATGALKSVTMPRGVGGGVVTLMVTVRVIATATMIMIRIDVYSVYNWVGFTNYSPIRSHGATLGSS